MAALWRCPATYWVSVAIRRSRLLRMSPDDLRDGDPKFLIDNDAKDLELEPHLSLVQLNP